MRKLMMTRRAMLLGSATGAVILSYAGSQMVAGVDAHAAETGYDYKPLYFDADEWALLQAFVDRLIPTDEEGPGALDVHVPEFIDRQMLTAYGRGELWYMHPPFTASAPQFGNQSPFAPRDIYRQGLRALDAAVMQRSGHKFSALSAKDRDDIITGMQKGTLTLSPVPAKLLFGQILKNCREGYFADPVHGGNFQMAAWKMIGFPGARADFTDWVDRYGARYPLGPVSVIGSEAG